jgi:hypothetical protein
MVIVARTPTPQSWPLGHARFKSSAETQTMLFPRLPLVVPPRRIRAGTLH